MTSHEATPNANDFLNYLSKSERGIIAARCTPLKLVVGQTLYTVGIPIKYVYFPTSGFCSLMTDVVDRRRIEVAMVGAEGMLGATLALGNKKSPMTAIVRQSGSALRMKADVFEDLVTRYPQIRALVLDYLYALLQQLTQSCACNKFHTVKQRLALWLLIMHDRTKGKRLHLTHDLLATMLGVRRSAITIAAGLMMQQGAISYSRGKLVVLSRKTLEKISCGCYLHSIDAYNESMHERG